MGKFALILIAIVVGFGIMGAVEDFREADKKRADKTIAQPQQSAPKERVSKPVATQVQNDRTEHCVQLAIDNGFMAASCAVTFITSCIEGEKQLTMIALGMAKSGGYLTRSACGGVPGGEPTKYDKLFNKLLSDF